MSDQWVLQVVKEGFRIGFVESSPDLFRATPCLVNGVKQQDLLNRIQKLLEKGAIVPVHCSQRGRGVYCTLFLVEKHSSDFRPVLDLKWLNQFIPHVKFKMLSLQIDVAQISFFICRGAL